MPVIIFIFSLLISSAYSTELIVAVIDSGTDVNHPDLKEFIWVNPGESGVDEQGHNKATNGVDDDGNGYIDDVHGWDFTQSTGKIVDTHGHGTHIAGIIAHRNTKVKIMTLKYYSPGQPGAKSLKYSTQAFHYALKMGAQIINYSGGGPSPDSSEREALLEASEKNVLVVAAAGNDGRSIESRGFYPASYGFSNILAVAAVNKDRDLSRISNYGAQTVHIAAPGEKILSTLPRGGHGTMTGTSQATAFVTAHAVRLLEKSPHLVHLPKQISQRLIHLANWNPRLSRHIKNAAALGLAPLSPQLGPELDAFGAPLPNHQRNPATVLAL